MARATPQVAGATLVDRADTVQSIAVDTPAWFAWLERATTFAFVGVAGHFTARKERRGSAGGYWKAYRKRAGVVQSAYLGKSADLTLERLQDAAVTLAASPIAGKESARPSRDPLAGEPAAHAAALPTGTVTFLFTDIEGSTQLWEQHPQAMHAALARHDIILRQAVETRGGVVFKTVGDSVHAVFARAADALAAALAMQRGLHAEPWGETGPLRVRVALHSGAAEERDGDYFGPLLNRVARILALGHGGQILLSHATHDLVADDLPDQITLRELGTHPLKDLSRPEHLFQVVGQDVPADFPPLRTQNTSPARSPPAAAPLLATKLFIPSLRPQLVQRPRLLDRVQTGLLSKLTLISAPAGYGKTTLLSAWRATPTGSAMPLAWVSLDAQDNDPTRFWTYVIAALETVYPAMGSAIGALLRAPQLPSMDAIVTSLINAISAMTMDAALILDDYHLITTPAIHATITFLLDHLPAHLHLILLTRADPPLPLTRLRTRGELTELRAADLRFTTDEATAFLTVMMGLPLTSGEVVALEARTEGWVAGLQLAALAMRDRTDRAGFVAAFSGSNRFVVDYLLEEVLIRLPTHLQTFVLQTSILDQLCGPLCDTVLGIESWELEVGSQPRSRPQPSTPNPQAAYSQLILEQLERANLFLVPLDDARHWYRYHHLFAEVLRARLHSGATASEVATLHQRASAWYEQAGLIGEAVRYAFLLHDSERAADLIERHAMALILASSDVLQVQAWVEQVPRTLILARPRLALIVGFTLALRGQLAAVEQLLAEAAPTLSAPDLPPNIVGELALLRSTIARFRRDAAGTLAFAQQALAQIALDNHGFRAAAAINVGVASIWCGEIAAAKAALAEAAALGELSGSQWITLGALEELASLQARAGELRQVLRTSEQAAQLSARLGGRLIPAAGMGQIGSAEVLYEWNDLTGATQAATEGIDLLRGTVESRLLVRGYIVLAQVHRAQADHDAALDCLDRCEAWFAQTPIAAPGALAALAAYRARLWVRHGDLTAAARWAHECAFADDGELGYVQQLTLVRLRLAQSRTDSAGQFLGEASTMLAQLLLAVEARGWTRYLIETLVLQALVCQAQADQTGGLIALERALTLAEPEGYIRIFVDEGASMVAPLTQIARGESSVARYAATLLQAFPRTEGRGLRTESPESIHSVLSPQSSALLEPLSHRELEVLRLIGDGHSNQAIADRLVVAVSTVKRHINNIYGKLDVQSRTQALVRARDLDLL
jgi:LuxR family transcriptional regulator, maltose regulon positive regulatory protein